MSAPEGRGDLVRRLRSMADSAEGGTNTGDLVALLTEAAEALANGPESVAPDLASRVDQLAGRLDGAVEMLTARVAALETVDLGSGVASIVGESVEPMVGELTVTPIAALETPSRDPRAEDT